MAFDTIFHDGFWEYIQIYQNLKNHISV